MSSPVAITTIVSTPAVTVYGGARGLQGVPGADGDAPQLVAASALSGHRAIAVDANGHAIYADQGEASAQTVYGISTGAAESGASVTLQRSGPMEWPAGGLTPDLPLYLGSAGLLTQIPPTTGWLRQIAVATAAARIVIEIGPAYFLGE